MFTFYDFMILALIAVVSMLSTTFPNWGYLQGGIIGASVVALPLLYMLRAQHYPQYKRNR